LDASKVPTGPFWQIAILNGKFKDASFRTCLDASFRTCLLLWIPHKKDRNAQNGLVRTFERIKIFGILS
jgi:hypothetical protein